MNTLQTDKQLGDPPDWIDLNQVVLFVGKVTWPTMSQRIFPTRHGRVVVTNLPSVLPRSNGECIATNVSTIIT